MFSTSEEEAVGNYSSLQRSKEEELQNLSQNAGEYPHHSPGFTGVLSSLSRIVKFCLKNDKGIASLEELETETLKQFKELEKPGFECLHVALVRRQRQPKDNPSTATENPSACPWTGLSPKLASTSFCGTDNTMFKRQP
ncbi:hypothetical protein ACJ72_01149 [Emergomyces africanus]|uniref:Uncharacterized protein n=1 Tax=Emergomyces africanus TaxID=1955775 RepID=A0A1B7P653_9EURO|nr:hypothetical protein ACJ72_01149 [Emergomyces africanus]